MRVLFSADWHIKLGQKNVPREWQYNRYLMFFDKIYELEKDVGIHIIGGDVFDSVPKPEELSLFFNFISKVSIPTFIYDGNHEATKKGQTFFKFLTLAITKMNSNVHVVDGIAEVDGMDIIPYTHLKTFNPSSFHNDILCTHVRGAISPHVIPEIDLELLSRWKIVLAGDLHSYENCQRNILYPGSPLSTSFHRKPIKNGVIILDTKSMQHEFIELGLPQLIRKTVSSEHEIIKTNYDHTIYEVTGNLLDLVNIDTNSDIIDKKIISKRTDSVLNLKDLSMQEELSLYLREVHSLPKGDIDEIIGIFDDYNRPD